nr:immunoglobulin light chain junction region [Mus musculus]NSL97521.1 immunoglobulin light chain junction region [Mus musculus]NSL98006.1 immunoglobulin light chain junction region [Mus musculus]NSL98151.1 immunoglobulin light chain junction region [Mus musculus]NSL98533.1 immunoglobulin light chain junction region [Mus musculus]
CGQSYSYPWTF